MSGQVTLRQEKRVAPNITTEIAGGLAELAMPFGSFSKNDEISLSDRER
ncbi:MAG: hypothetical protein IPN69_17515 [Acidobacteria bacterium]|nr:hypothetical protein [Acidobacteriota bacterium]